MARIRADYLSGTTDAALTAVDTTLSSSALADLPTVTAPDYIALVLNDGTNYEVVHATHTAAATTATIARGQEGSTAQAWASGVDWLHGPTKYDVPTVGATEPPADVPEDHLWFDTSATPTLAAASVSVTTTAFANIVGADVQTALDSIDDQLGTASGGITVQDENGNVGTGVTQIDFQGAGVTAAAGTGEVVVTIAGGGGSSTASAARVTKSADQALTAGSWTQLTWNAEAEDSGGYHDNATNNPRLTIPSNGVYVASSTVFISFVSGNSTAVVQRNLEIRKNGDTTTAGVMGRNVEFSSGSIAMQVTTGPLRLTAGDYLDAWAYAASETWNATSVLSWFGIHRIGD